MAKEGGQLAILAQLIPPLWPISINTLPADGRLRITDRNTAARPHRCYRAVMG